MEKDHGMREKTKAAPIGESDTIDVSDHYCAETRYVDMCSYKLTC